MRAREREREREERMNDKDILLHMIHLDVCAWLLPEKKLIIILYIADQ